MNQNIATILMTHLDQAVTPLHARDGRKQAIREELLAHLFGLYERAYDRLHDEEAALNEALQHFGAVENLRDELDASVPRWERMLYLTLGNKENLMWRLFLVLGVVLFLVGMAFVMPAVQQMLYHETMTHSVFLLMLGTAVTLGGVWSVFHGVQRFRTRNL